MAESLNANNQIHWFGLTSRLEARFAQSEMHYIHTHGRKTGHGGDWVHFPGCGAQIGTFTAGAEQARHCYR